MAAPKPVSAPTTQLKQCPSIADVTYGSPTYYCEKDKDPMKGEECPNYQNLANKPLPYFDPNAPAFAKRRDMVMEALKKFGGSGDFKVVRGLGPHFSGPDLFTIPALYVYAPKNKGEVHTFQVCVELWTPGAADLIAQECSRKNEFPSQGEDFGKRLIEGMKQLLGEAVLKILQELEEKYPGCRYKKD